MAILWFDGCGEYYDSAHINRVWDTVSDVALPLVEAAGGRRGGACIRLDNSTEHFGKGFPAAQTIVVGWAGKMQIPASTSSFLRVYGVNRHISFSVDTNGAIRIIGPTVEIANSANDVVVDDEYQYYEMKVKVASSGGFVEVRVNGVEVINETGLDTHDGTNGDLELARSIVFRCPTISAGHRVDDVYVLDDSGDAPYKDFLGDIRVDTLFPTGDGAQSQFDTATPSSNHWENVDETPADDETSYNESATAADKDLFTFPALPVITPAHTHFGVKVMGWLRKTDAGIADHRFLCRPDATNFDNGTDLACETEYRAHFHIFEEDPDASAPWVDATVNASEFGLEVI